MSEPRDFTVKEYAARERVDERTVRRWLLKGAVYYRRTPGGGIRILGESPEPSNMTKSDNRGHPSA